MTDTHATTLVHAETREVQRMHPLVSAALSTGTLDPTTLRDLLAVQREWESGEARKAYTRALADLKRDLPTVIGHDTTVDFETRSGRTRYTHSSLAAVMDAITEPLTRHGFSLSWVPSSTERAVQVTCRLTHSEGHFEESTLSCPPEASGTKNAAQAIASAITLLQRYTALALLGIATRDMREPTGEKQEVDAREDERIEPGRNMAAVKAIVQAGRTREAAEAHLGKPVSEWTRADRAEIRAWLDATPEAAR